MRYRPFAILTLLITSIAAAGVFYPDGATTLHFAFEGNPNGDRPVIRPPAFYAHDAGFGFVDSPGLIGNVNGVQAPGYFRYDVNVPPGNYDVTVRVGSQVASNTTIKAEAHRVMAFNISTAARGSANVTFTVHVGASGRPDEKSLDLDDRLTLEFTGQTPAMMKLDIKPNSAAPTLYILGDAEAADREDVPRAGWGQMLPVFFKPGEMAVANLSQDAGTLADAMPVLARSLKKGDTVMLAPELAALDGPRGDAYRQALESAAAAIGGKQADLVLLMPAPGRDFNADGQFKNLSSKATENWLMDFAARQKVPLFPLRDDASSWLTKLGPENAKAAFAWYPANTFRDQPRELKEDNRLSAYGAFEFARMVAREIQAAKIPLAAHLYPDIPPANSDPAQFPQAVGYAHLKK